MSRSVLRGVEAAPGSVRVWAAALGDALEGSGPALLPLPVGAAAGARQAMADAYRPDDATAPAEVDELALVVPTSGSTGEPKGVLLTAGAIRASVAATAERLSGPGRWVLALPLTHVAGLMVVARAVLAGSAPVQLASGAGFDPEAFAAATHDAARTSARAGLPLYTSLVPTQLDRLLTAGCDLRSYAAVLLGAAAAPAQLLDRALDAGAAVVTTYGLSETCGGCVYDGRPLEGVQVTVDGAGADRVGRVLIGGPTLFSGYRLRPDLTAAALDHQGRLRTGDLGRWEAGRLGVVGRIDDVIISGGENVAPGPVERVLAELTRLGSGPAVTAWCVVGVPDAHWGEQVVAVAAADPGVDLGPVARLRALAADRLPAASLPRALVRVDVLPTLATGKVDRAQVRSLAAAAVGTGAGR
jgi:O-succinylbenzoic acid--CoA ligase